MKKLTVYSVRSCRFGQILLWLARRLGGHKPHLPLSKLVKPCLFSANPFICYLSTHLCITLSIFLSLCVCLSPRPVYLSIRQIQLPIYLSIYLSIVYLSFSLLTFPFDCLFQTNLAISFVQTCLSLYVPANQSIHFSIHRQTNQQFSYLSLPFLYHLSSLSVYLFTYLAKGELTSPTLPANPTGPSIAFCQSTIVLIGGS